MAEASCSTQQSPPAQQAAWGTRLEPIFGADLRSLAATRVAVAGLILLDLALRARDLSAHYSDLGVLPRAVWIQNYGRGWRASLHLLSGQPPVMGALFLLAAVFAVFLLLGYRTRLATAVSWVLLISLQARNPLLLNSADNVLVMMLMWGLFVPWGARYSIDAALDPQSDGFPKRVLSFGSAAMLLQMPLVYVATGIMKKGPTWHRDLSAVAYTLRAEHFTTPLGRLLGELPLGLFAFATVAVLILEIVGPLLLFVPYRTASFRVPVLVLFTLLQASFGLTLFVGFFPLVSIVATLPLVPSELWDRRAQKRPKAQAHYDLDCGFCRKSAAVLATFLGQPRPLPAQLDESIFSDMERMRSWVVEFEGERFFEWEGFVALVRASWLRPLAPVLRLSPIAWVGKRGYRAVADRRDLAGRFTRVLKERPLTFRSSKLGALLCAFLLTYTLVGTLESLKVGVRIPQSMLWVKRMLEIQTRWSMFAPNPPRATFWVVAEGTLVSGEELELHHRSPIPQSKPKLVSQWYPNYRWRKYYDRLRDKRFRKFRNAATVWHCRTWNREHQGDERLKSMRLMWNKEASVLDGSQGKIERGRVAWRNCPGIEAAEPVAETPSLKAPQSAGGRAEAEVAEGEKGLRGELKD